MRNTYVSHTYIYMVSRINCISFGLSIFLANIERIFAYWTFDGASFFFMNLLISIKPELEFPCRNEIWDCLKIILINFRKVFYLYIFSCLWNQHICADILHAKLNRMAVKKKVVSIWDILYTCTDVLALHMILSIMYKLHYWLTQCERL